MFMNAYQKYISELLSEYGSLLKSQLLKLVNHKFKCALPNLNGYVSQLCRFADFEEIVYGRDTIVLHKGDVPDYDMIRSVSVMLSFLESIVMHNKSSGMITIRFYVSSGENDKEISIIPVKQGGEKQAQHFADDKFTDTKCEVVIFLLDNREQKQFIKAKCNCKFAVISEKGPIFYKK